MLQDKIRPVRMNVDTDDRSMQSGDVREMVNCRVASSSENGSGAVEPVKGNILINNPLLPGGENVCIGTTIDQGTGNIIYYVWNSLNQHSIFLLKKGATGQDTIETILRSPVLNFSKDKLITGSTLVNGELLYWTDNHNPPRKINIKKANNTGKLLKHRVYFQHGRWAKNIFLDPLAGSPNKRLGSALNYTIEAFLKINNTQYSLLKYTKENKTPQEFAELVASSINKPNNNISDKIEAKVVGKAIEITNKQVGANYTFEFWTTQVGGNVNRTHPGMVVAENYYPTPLQELYINRAKAPTNVEPVARYHDFPVINAGDKGIKDAHFRFRARVVYDDGEKSVWSPISTIPINHTPKSNLIEVNYNCSLFWELANLAIIHRVDIAVQNLSKEGWHLAASLEREDMYSGHFMFQFFNNNIYQQLSNEDMIRPYDYVPLKSQSLEYISDRIFDGGITEGYNNVDIDVKLSVEVRADLKVYAATNILKGGGKYQYGIVYFDKAGRSTFVNSNDLAKVEIPYLNLNGNGRHDNFGSNKEWRYLPKVDWQIYHNAPSWATHYQWVRTRNLKFGNYFQWISKRSMQLNEFGEFWNTGNLTQMQFRIDNYVEWIGINKDFVAQDIKLTDGDYVRFICGLTKHYFHPILHRKVKGDNKAAGFNVYVEVGKKEEEHIILKREVDVIYTSAENYIIVGDSPFIEIYSPKTAPDNEWFYEIGETFECKNGLHFGLGQHQKASWRFTDNYHVNGFTGFEGTTNHTYKVGDIIVIRQDAGYLHSAYNVQAKITAVSQNKIATDIPWAGSSPVNPGTVYCPATGTMRTGDAWLRERGEIPRREGAFDEEERKDNKPSNNMWNYYWVEDQFINDVTKVVIKPTQLGRVHIPNKDAAQIERKSTIRFTGKYIQGSKINDLSRMEGLNEKQYPSEYGWLNKLQKAGDVLLGIFENQTISMYIEKAILKDMNGQTITAISDKVIASHRELQGGFGTSHPETVAVDSRGTVYYWDSRRGAVVKRSEAGLDEISGLIKKFSTYFQKQKNKAATAVYDPVFQEYLLTFKEEGYKPTVAYNEFADSWTTFYSFNPEAYGVGSNDQLYSFKNGQIYKHNALLKYNNFYGVQYDQIIRAVSNSHPSTIKNWLRMGLESLSPYEVQKIVNQYGQESELLTSDFENFEGIWSAEFLRDKNTPNTEHPLLYGDDLRSETLDVLLVNKNDTHNKLYCINLYYIVSNILNK
jgi:hypothetical protein